MNILLIETATQVCSVAVAKESRCVAQINSNQPNAHSSMLSTFINEAMNASGLAMHQLDGVCVSSGPGSYTGLRIGVSSAKGLCYALDIPLVAVPTLENMAGLFFEQHPDYEGLVCPMIDARRMECYTALYSRKGIERETTAEIIEEGIYNRWLDAGEVTFIGDGAEKTRPIIGIHQNAKYCPDFQISATGMIQIAEQKIGEGKTENVAYFEPFYLKDFVAKKSVVHGLRDT